MVKHMASLDHRRQASKVTARNHGFPASPAGPFFCRIRVPPNSRSFVLEDNLKRSQTFLDEIMRKNKHYSDQERFTLKRSWSKACSLKKMIDFFDHDVLQLFEFERFTFDYLISCDQETL